MLPINPPEIGKPFPEAAKQVNNFMDAANIRTELDDYSSHLKGRMRLFGMGDSMNGYGMSNGYASYFAMMRMYFYDADVCYNHGAYFDYEPNRTNNPNEGGIPWPDGPRGWNFACGGKNVKHMTDIQMSFVREAYIAGTLPLHFIISTFQNDQFWQQNARSPEDLCLSVITMIDELMDVMGRRGILLGPWPHTQLAEDAAGKHYIDQRMRDYAATKPGLVYVSILDALKTGSASEEADNYLNYKGWQIQAGQPGRASWDAIHAAPYAAYIVAKLAAEGVKLLVRRFPSPVFEARAYNKSQNKLGNFYGPMGRLAGSGGTIIDVANSSPSAWTRTPTNNLPAGFELIYDHSKGIALTPALTGDPERPLVITASGTPTADFLWVLRMAAQLDVPNGYVELYGKARWISQRGWGGIGFGNAGEGAPGIIPGDPIIPLNGVGGAGGADYVMPFEMNDLITFHSQVNGVSFGSRKLPLDVTGGFANGIAASGSLEISRLGLFPMSRPQNY